MTGDRQMVNYEIDVISQQLLRNSGIR